MNVKTDKDIVCVIDDVYHYLKCSDEKTPLREDFQKALRGLIEKHGLGWDQHSYARLPEDKDT